MAVSHTGAQAGADRMNDALFRQTGVIRAQTFGDLLNIPAALDRNPIDVASAGLRPDLLRGAIQALLASPAYDALVVIVGSSGVGQPDLMAGAIEACLRLSDKPVLAYVSPHAPEAATLLTQRGVPAFVAGESCTAALAGMLQASQWQAPAAEPDRATPVRTEDLPAGSLDEAQAKHLFSRFGIPCARETIVQSAAEAERAAHAFGGGGVELILGMHRDALGTAILLGMGGVTAELFNDTAMRLLPAEGGFARGEAWAMARELRTWPLLDGFRGRPRADVEALADAIVAFARLAAQLGDRLVEAEINPIFVLPEGRGVRAADGVVVLADVRSGSA